MPSVMLKVEHQSAQMSKITNDWLKLFNPVWHWIPYSCTHMAAVGIKGF